MIFTWGIKRRLKKALKEVSKCHAVLIEQMEAESDKLNLTTYGQLPGWDDYERANQKVQTITMELL